MELPEDLEKRLDESRKRRGKRKSFAVFSGQEDEFEGKDGKGKRGKGTMSRYNKPGLETGNAQFQID